MEYVVVPIRWGRVIIAGCLPLVLTHLALILPAVIAPGLNERFGTWTIIAGTVVWTALAAAAVAVSVPPRDAARHGLAVGSIAALLDLFFYGTFGFGAPLLFALTIAVGAVAGTLVGRRSVQ